METFIIRALLAGIGIALLAGPLGCLVVWQRMSYFGATLSHAALLGVSLGFALSLTPFITIIGVCIVISLFFIKMQKSASMNADTALGILAHTSLALGIVALMSVPTLRIDVLSYLFGDILTVRWIDILIIYGVAAVILPTLIWLWRPLLLLITQRDLALVDGVAEQRVRLVFLLALSATVAVAMQVVGMLLTVSMLIIPAACARRFARTPESMACISILVAAIAVVVGIYSSLTLDSATGPSIVIAASILFCASLVAGPRRLN